MEVYDNLAYGSVEMWGQCIFFFSSRRRHTRYWRDWSSDVCSSDLYRPEAVGAEDRDKSEAHQHEHGRDQVEVEIAPARSGPGPGRAIAEGNGHEAMS